MSLSGILKLMERHPEFCRSIDEAAAGASPAATVRQGARPAFIAALARRASAPLLVVTPRPEDARRLHDQLLSWMGEDAPVHLLPEPEVLPFERLAVDANTGNQRLAALAALAAARHEKHADAASENGDCPPVVVCSIGSALLYTAPPGLMAGALPSANTPSIWRVGDRVRLDEVLTLWVQMGYRHEPVVDSPGSFSHRGGILDIYPPDCELPLRIELFDDEIDTIRRFDPLTQRSVGAADEVRPIPAREHPPVLSLSKDDQRELAARADAMDLSDCAPAVRERIEEELRSLTDPGVPETNPEILSFYGGLINRTPLLDYLGPGATVLLERGGRVEAEASELEERFGRMRSAREERGELPRNFPSPCMTWDEFAARLAEHRTVDLQTWVGEDEDPVFLPAVPYYGRLEQLSADIKRRSGEPAALVAVTQHARRVAELLEQHGVTAEVMDALDRPPKPGQVCVLPGSLPNGWVVEIPHPPFNSPPEGGKRVPPLRGGKPPLVPPLRGGKEGGAKADATAEPPSPAWSSSPTPSSSARSRNAASAAPDAPSAGRTYRWPTWSPASSSSTSTTASPASPARR